MKAGQTGKLYGLDPWIYGDRQKRAKNLNLGVQLFEWLGGKRKCACLWPRSAATDSRIESGWIIVPVALVADAHVSSC